MSAICWLSLGLLFIFASQVALALLVWSLFREERQRQRKELEDWKAAVSTSLTLMEQRVERRLDAAHNLPAPKRRTMFG